MHKSGHFRFRLRQLLPNQFQCAPRCIRHKHSVHCWKNHIQKSMILEAAEKGSCVIVGRCADYILREHPRVLSVFIYADYQQRRINFKTRKTGLYNKNNRQKFPAEIPVCYPLCYTLNRYPTPHIVSIYCGLDVSNSIFSLIFLICTVTVAISPIDSISQISRNNSSFVYT